MKVELRGEVAYFGTGSGALDSANPAMLFVHGAGFDHSVWVMPARYFARHGFSVIAPDLPGHGRSGGEGLSAVADMADWLVELLAATGHDSAHVIGHSMGSLVALNLARRHPDRVAQVALLGTSAPMPVGPPLLNAAEDDHVAAEHTCRRRRQSGHPDFASRAGRLGHRCRVEPRATQVVGAGLRRPQDVVRDARRIASSKVSRRNRNSSREPRPKRPCVEPWN